MPHGPLSADALCEILAKRGCPGLLEGVPIPDRITLDLAPGETEPLGNVDDPVRRVLLPSVLLSQRTREGRRHLGEFYTPRWLVELALARVGWPHPDMYLTDPACGAGIFLGLAAVAVRSSPGALPTVAQRISGADIQPLAVLAARVACLGAVADLLEPRQPFEPDIRVADLLQSTPPAAADIVVGNPPWIRFSDLPPETQARAAAWARDYDLLPRSSYHGGSELDVSAVFAYRMLDAHLKPAGRAALVMPACLLRSSASANFRRFCLPGPIPLQLEHVTDFGTVRVFPDATNRTALLCWTKGRATPSSVPAETVSASRSPAPDLSRTDARAHLQPIPLTAHLVGPDHRMVLLPPETPIGSLQGPSPQLRGRKGVTTDLNGAYFVRVVGPGSQPHLVTVQNDIAKRGKPVPAHLFEVERDLVFPLLKGAREIRPFGIDAPRSAILVPNRRITGALDEHAFRASFPATYAHFQWVEERTNGALTARSTYRRMLAPTGAPFFFVYNVGAYTFAPVKVVWAEIARTLIAGLVDTTSGSGDLPGQVVVPDHKVYFCPFDEIAPAQFLCALLNSTVVRTCVDAVTEKLQVGALLDRVCLPAFDPHDAKHRAVVEVAAEATTDFGAGQRERIDRLAIEILG